MGHPMQEQGNGHPVALPPARQSLYAQAKNRKVSYEDFECEEPATIDRRQRVYVTAQVNGGGHGGYINGREPTVRSSSNGHVEKPPPTSPITPQPSPVPPPPPAMTPEQLRELQRQLRSQAAPVGFVEAASFHRQGAALQLVRQRGVDAGQGYSGGPAAAGVLPRATASKPPAIIENDDSAEVASTVRFMTKEEVQKMRTEMRQHCGRRQQEQARRRLPTGGDCPLLLSQRMLRIMEFALGRRLTEEVVPAAGDTLNAVQLDDAAAQAVAALIYHHHFAPASVLQFLDEANGASNAQELYLKLLETMGRELRDGLPASVNLAAPLDVRLPAVFPTCAGEAALRFMGPPTLLANFDGLSRNRRGGGGGGDLRAWFGDDSSSGSAPLLIRRKIHMTDLPIFQKKQLIMDTVQHNRLVLLQGETGSGKTTQVPQYMLEMIANTPRGACIVCTQPRRIAAITVAKRVAEELGEVVGEGLVGYKIRGVSVCGPNCKILFCTTGVLLRRIANERPHMFSKSTMTHLLVDEIHERGCEADFMLTFLREVIQDRPELRVVLMSATMDAQCFLRYFQLHDDVVIQDGVVSGKQGSLKPPPLLLVSGRCFPVHEVFLDHINMTLGREVPTMNDGAMSYDELRREKPQSQSENDGIDYDLVVSILTEIDKSDDGAWHFVLDKDAARPTDVGREGAVLIFLPGAGEIQQLMAAIDESCVPDHWWVIPLHGALTTEEQQDAFRTVLPEGKTWKIILCTNVAETSVTVPDVTVVIDSCRERRTGIDKFSNTPSLKEQFCAQDSLTQRRGRAGRVRPGVCLRLISQRKLESLDPKTPPEMQRIPLENIYLMCCSCGITDQASFLAKTPDPPDEASVDFARATLFDMGALDTAAEDGLSPLGRHLAAMPCHPRLGKILILGCLLGVPGPVMSICAAMSGRSALRTTQDTAKRSAWQAERLKLLKELGHKSDHCVWAVLMQLWMSEGVVRRDLCNTYGLSYERMSAAFSERKHLCEALTQAGFLPADFLQTERSGCKIAVSWADREQEDGFIQDEPQHEEAPPPDWAVVRAAISGGLFPNIVRVEKTAPKNPSNADIGERNKWMRYSFLQRQVNGGENTGYPKSCNMHPNSVCFGQDHFECPLLCFYTMQQTTKLYVYDVSEVTPWALLLFGSQPTWNDNTRTVEVGGWARFHCTHKEPMWTLINTARAAVEAVLARKVSDVPYDPATSPELAGCIELIQTWGLGFHRLGEEPTWPFLEELRQMGADALEETEKQVNV